jgi:hypothetical protein
VRDLPQTGGGPDGNIPAVVPTDGDALAEPAPTPGQPIQPGGIGGQPTQPAADEETPVVGGTTPPVAPPPTAPSPTPSPTPTGEPVDEDPPKKPKKTKNPKP